MRRLTLVLGAAAAMMLPPSLSLADEERDRIEATIVSLLQGSGEGEPAVAHEDVQVTAEEEGYRVLVTGLETDARENASAPPGAVSFRIRTVGADYAFDQVVLPQPLFVTVDYSDWVPEGEDQPGQEIPDYDIDVAVRWEKLSLSGIWSPELQLPIALDLKLADLLLEIEPKPAASIGLTEQQPLETSVGTLDLLLETDPKSRTDWDWTLRTSVSSAKSVLPDVAMNMALAGQDLPGFPETFLAEFVSELLSMTVEVTGFNPRSYQQLFPALKSYFAAAESLDQEAILESRQEVLDLDRLFQGLLVTWRSRGLVYEELWPGGVRYQESQEGRYVLEAPLGKDELRLAYIGEAEAETERRPGVGALYSLRHRVSGPALSGLALAILPLNVMLESLIPERSSLSLVIDGLPLSETTNLMVTAMAGIAANVAKGESTEPVDLSTLMPADYDAWLAALDRAPTRIALDRLSLSNPIYWLEGTADLTVDTESASGVVGYAELTLSDIDEAVRLVRERVEGLFALSEDEESIEGQIGAAITVGVAAAKGLGDPKVKDGAIVYGYDFELPADQPATLNGRPLSNLFGP